MSGKTIAVACCVFAFLGAALAQDPPELKRQMNKLYQQQTLIAVQGRFNDIGFLPDNDPDTIQVVFMTDPTAKSHVSDDGEVVFLSPNLGLNQQNYYTEEAIRRKAKRILASQTPAPK